MGGNLTLKGPKRKDRQKNQPITKTVKAGKTDLQLKKKHESLPVKKWDVARRARKKVVHK